MSTLQSRADEVLERGFTVFEGLHDASEVARCRRALEERHAALGSPACYASPPKMLGPDMELSQSGLILNRTLVHHPDFASLLAPPEVVATIRLLLGEQAELELTSIVMADASRTFFEWHNHIGGPDEQDARKFAGQLRFERSQRVMTLTYLHDIDAESGPLLAYPRRISDPTAAPFSPELQDWPGQEELRFAQGSVVLMDQCTWHAARQKHSPGLRILIGAWFRSAETPATRHVDESLRSCRVDDALMRSLLPGAPQRPRTAGA